MISNITYVILILIGLILLYLVEKIFVGIRFINSDEVGIVEKWWSQSGNLKNGSFIALSGEAGYQPDVLRAGLSLRPSIMFKVHKVPLVTIPQGQLGYIFARDGQAMVEGQRLGRKVECNNFQDIRTFLKNQGQKGTQISILREGTYALNLAQFIIFTASKTYYLSLKNSLEEQEIKKISEDLQRINAFKPIVIDSKEDLIGIVNVHEGPALNNGQIIAPIVGVDANNPETYHNNFQDPTKFLKAGGFGGRQHQVLTEGTYYINRKFATIELIPKTVIPVGFVGVVNSFVGIDGKDISGEEYKHGELVQEGCRGVWSVPLKPGKYAFNTLAGTVIPVPTTNFILKWVNNETGGHKFDENLKEVSLITKDAFEPTLPLSVVVNIDYKKAPYVIQRFGDIKKLVEQTLDPMVASHFKNIAQKMTLIELIQSRSEIQEQATWEMKKKFGMYNLEVEEVLIGTPSPNDDPKIEDILKQLSDRQLAKEQIETYEAKMKAAETEKKLREVEARAKQQSELTNSEIDITIQENIGKAQYQKALKDADTLRAKSDAEAYKTKTLAQADAEREARVGIAKAIATVEQVKAYGGAKYQVTQDVLTKFSEAVKQGNIEIVPRSIVNLGGSGESSVPNIFEALMGVILSEKLGTESMAVNNEKESKLVEKLKKDILDSINEKKEKAENTPQYAETIEAKEATDN